MGPIQREKGTQSDFVNGRMHFNWKREIYFRGSTNLRMY